MELDELTYTRLLVLAVVLAMVAVWAYGRERLAAAGLARNAAGVVFPGQVPDRLQEFQRAAAEAPAR